MPHNPIRNLRQLTLMLATAASCLLAMPAHAVYTMTLTESGGNVVASGSGTLNLTGLTSDGSTPAFPSIAPVSGYFAFGSAPGSVDRYTGITGPTAYGTGIFAAVVGGTGGLVGMTQLPTRLYVPQGYTSSSSLANTATWTGTTFSSLGLTPGTYTWTWGSDSMVLQIGAPAPTVSNVPTLSEWGLIALTGLMGLFGLRQMRRKDSSRLG
jgi:hypothetical protein